MASRLQVFHENVDAIQSMYASVMLKVDGTQESADVFEQLCGAVDAAIQPQSQDAVGDVKAEAAVASTPVNGLDESNAAEEGHRTRRVA